ncbi:MAG: hypothetical protein HY651_05355 [Acidobacteria bacterium]|nr:hypothetical protein [Acidobacteriota bacterium]
MKSAQSADHHRIREVASPALLFGQDPDGFRPVGPWRGAGRGRGPTLSPRDLNPPLPTGWTGNVDITIRYVTVAASPSGNVEWEVSTVCRAIAESWDASYNPAQTITDAVGAQNQANDATQTNITMTGCAAGEDLMLRIGRDGVNDTNNDLAKMLYALVTLRRTQ